MFIAPHFTLPGLPSNNTSGCDVPLEDVEAADEECEDRKWEESCVETLEVVDDKNRGRKWEGSCVGETIETVDEEDRGRKWEGLHVREDVERSAKLEWEDEREKEGSSEDAAHVGNTDALYDRVSRLAEDVNSKLAELASFVGDDSSTANGGKSHPTEISATPSLISTVKPEGDRQTSSCSSNQSTTQFADRKTQKAYEKMLKLDERLASLCRREKEVKRQRRLLEEQMERVGAAQPSNVPVSENDGEGAVSSLIQFSHAHVCTSFADRAISPLFRTQPDDVGKSVTLAECALLISCGEL